MRQPSLRNHPMKNCK